MKTKPTIDNLTRIPRMNHSVVLVVALGLNVVLYRIRKFRSLATNRRLFGLLEGSEESI